MNEFEDIFVSTQKEVQAQRTYEELTQREKQNIYRHNLNFIVERYGYITRHGGEFRHFGNEVWGRGWLDIAKGWRKVSIAINNSNLLTENSLLHVKAGEVEIKQASQKQIAELIAQTL